MQERFVEKNKHLLQECTNVQSVDGSCLCVGAWVVACVGGCVVACVRACAANCFASVQKKWRRKKKGKQE